jgi:hypothetical protein
MTEGVSVDQFFRSRIATVAGIAAALGGILIGCTRSGKVATLDDEDRSQIIVRGGSAIFDDGSGANAHGWMPGNPGNPRDKKQWQPNQPNGASVSSYAVTVQLPANAVGNPSTPCPTLPLVGKLVTVEYTLYTPPTPPAPLQFTFSFVQVNPSGKMGPLLASTVDLDATSTASQLIYDQQEGWISKVTVAAGANQGDPSQSCSFDDPKIASTAKAVIVLQPLR